VPGGLPDLHGYRGSVTVSITACWLHWLHPCWRYRPSGTVGQTDNPHKLTYVGCEREKLVFDTPCCSGDGECCQHPLRSAVRPCILGSFPAAAAGIRIFPSCTFPSRSFPGHDYLNVNIASVVTLWLELGIELVSFVTFM